MSEEHECPTCRKRRENEEMSVRIEKERREAIKTGICMLCHQPGETWVDGMCYDCAPDD